MNSTEEFCRPEAVFVELTSRQAGRIHTSLYADLDGGMTTIQSDAPDVVALLEQIKTKIKMQKVVDVNSIKPAGAATAATLAAAMEAVRVHPRLDKIFVKQLEEESRINSTECRFRLPKPDLSLSMPVGIALSRRQSQRSFGPLSPKDLSTLLFHSARVRTVWTCEDGFAATSRPSPSAGARHPIDLIVVCGKQETEFRPSGHKGSTFRFDPFTCELVCLSDPEDNYFEQVMANAVMLLGAEPPIIVVFQAYVGRTLSRYRGGLSLVYRDAGALLATFSLVASALDISCCPLAVTVPESQFVLSVFSPNGPGLNVGGVAIGA